MAIIRCESRSQWHPKNCNSDASQKRISICPSPRMVFVKSSQESRTHFLRSLIIVCRESHGNDHLKLVQRTENYFHKTLIKANVWIVIIYYPSLMQTINTSGPVYDSHDDFISHGKQTTRLPINGEIWPLLVGHTNDDIENCCPIREWFTMKQTENGKNHTCKW